MSHGMKKGRLTRLPQSLRQRLGGGWVGAQPNRTPRQPTGRAAEDAGRRGIRCSDPRRVWRASYGKIALAALLLVAGFRVEASRVERLSLTQIRDFSQDIVIGTVTRVSTRTGSTGKMVWTDYEVSLSETLKGDPGAFRIVSFAGGKDGDLEIGIVGIPHLTVGSRYVLFLMPPENFASATVGWGQGIFEIVPIETDAGPREVLISHDHEVLEIVGGGEIGRGARVALEENRLVPHGSGLSEAREPDPVILYPNGEPAPLQSFERPQEPSLEGRVFATLDELRRFVKGGIEEATPMR